MLRADYYVGGLPLERGVNGEWEYFGMFNTYDTIDEFVRPARTMVDGKETVFEAGSGRFMMDVSHVVGRPLELEAWYSDGLRSLLTLPIPNMKEMTLRYPGHVAKMVALREAGEFAPGAKLDATAKRFTEADWRKPAGAVDMLCMVLEFENAAAKWSYTVYDEAVDGIPAMSRCTGYMATSSLDVLASKAFDAPGVHALEHVAANKGAFDTLMAGLARRGIKVVRKDA